MFLATNTQSLEIILGGSATTNELEWWTDYVDTDVPGASITSIATADGVTNGGTAVTLLAAPTSGTTRQVLHFACFNADTATAVVILQIHDGSNVRRAIVVSLDPGDNLSYEAGAGWRVLDSTGAAKGSGGGGGGSMAIGSAVGGSPMDYAVLLVDASGDLGQVSGLGTSGYILTSNGAAALPTWQAAAGGGSPAGSDQQVQYNDSGAFGADANFTWSYPNQGLTITGSTTGAAIYVSGGTAGMLVANFCWNNNNSAATFEDGTNTVEICNTTYSFKDNTGVWEVNGVPYAWTASQGAASSVLTNDGSGNLSWGAGGGGLAIGDAITGGSSNCVLYADASGNLAEGAMTYDTVGQSFYVGSTAGNIAIRGVNGNWDGRLADDVHGCAGYFTDNSRVVSICDGANHITYAVGNGSDWNSGSPTDVWVALDRIAAAVAGLLGGAIP